MKTLAGDRGIEWKWAMDHLPIGSGHVLDLGPMNFNLSLHAAMKGYHVIAVGLEHLPHVPEDKDVLYVRKDVLEFDPGDMRFDFILNISSTEHIGLGRYGDPIGEDFDLQTMARLREWMGPESKQILTVPVGQDAVVGHWHRVFGSKRLPRLLEGYLALEEMFWVKSDDDKTWIPCSMEQAFEEVPGTVPEPSMLNLSYALGAFVLCLA